MTKLYQCFHCEYKKFVIVNSKDIPKEKCPICGNEMDVVNEYHFYIDKRGFENKT